MSFLPPSQTVRRPTSLKTRTSNGQPPELDRNHGVRLAVGVVIPKIANKALHWRRHHRLPTSDHHEHLVASYANLALNVTNKFTAVDVEKRLSVRERISAELLAQPDGGWTQPVHGFTTRAEFSEPPRLEQPAGSAPRHGRSRRSTGVPCQVAVREAADRAHLSRTYSSRMSASLSRAGELERCS